MGYGKLEIYWPGRDGLVESYRLEKSTVAIGRSSGNDIVLETTSVSRYHISLQFQDNNVFLQDLDSANGTYVDGERAKPNELIPLYGGEEILIGDLRLIYMPDIEETDTTQSTRPPKTTTIRVEAIKAKFRIDLDPPLSPVTPGAHMQAVLLIDHTGTETDRFSIEVEGIPTEWIRVERSELEIDPGMQIPINITIKPLRRSTTRPGDYTVIVRVRAQSEPDHPLEAIMPLVVRPYSGFGILLATPRITREIPFELRVHNQGSGVLPIVLVGATSDQSLIVTPTIPNVALSPGENRIIQGYVRPRRDRIIGPPRERRFDLQVRAQDASGFLAAVQGTYIDRSWLPTWILGVVGVLGVLLIASCLAVLMFVLRPRTAEIVSFTIEPTTIYRNLTQQVNVSWRVNNVQRVRLQTDGIRLHIPLPDDVSAVNQLQIIGVVSNAATITLLVEGEDGEAVLDPRSLLTVPPTCLAAQAVPAYNGPALNYAPSSPLAAGQVYAVDRRDLSGTWLRLEGTMLWVPTTALNCSIFSVADLVQVNAEEIPPTPMPTATITATSTPTNISTATSTATPTVTLPPISTPAAVGTLPSEPPVTLAPPPG